MAVPVFRLETDYNQQDVEQLRIRCGILLQWGEKRRIILSQFFCGETHQRYFSVYDGRSGKQAVYQPGWVHWQLQSPADRAVCHERHRRRSDGTLAAGAKKEHNSCCDCHDCGKQEGKAGVLPMLCAGLTYGFTPCAPLLLMIGYSFTWPGPRVWRSAWRAWPALCCC